ncbi:MAG: hypothetical protein U0797_04855 [Gemmataceae bacterium]
MARILVNLTAFNLTALAAAFAAGWLSFFRHGRGAEAGDPTYLLHIFLGLTAATTTLGVHSLVFIYFLGTGRWVKEVCLAYQIPDEPLPRTTRELKRQAFPAALAAMLVPIATSAAGAGVATLQWSWVYHATLGVLTLAVNVWAFVREYHCVRTNAVVIDEVMREVERIRSERGLPSNEEALRQQQS